jgi:hypothetical protein
MVGQFGFKKLYTYCITIRYFKISLEYYFVIGF